MLCPRRSTLQPGYVLFLFLSYASLLLEVGGGRPWHKEKSKSWSTVTLQWEAKIPKGQAPTGRGYHVALLHDARIFISGGYKGVSVFDDLWALDLSAAAYLPQVVCPLIPFPPSLPPSFSPRSINYLLYRYETTEGEKLMIDYIRSRRNEEFPKWYPCLIEFNLLYTCP